MLLTSDITVVFQGSIKSYVDGDGSFQKNLKRTKKALPNAQFILSTWEDVELPRSITLDEIIISKDPGGLLGIKYDSDAKNNINRQIVSTLRGLRAVKTKYAIKIRTDAYLEHAGFLDFFNKYNENAILVNSFFTVDPLIFERIYFHLSDWFQFGLTKNLISYWSVDLFPKEFAIFYDNNEHLKKNLFLQSFRAKFAVEQYLCVNYASKLGYVVPTYLGEENEKIRNSFHDFIKNETIICDPSQIGLVFPKYLWAYTSKFQYYNCINHLDWKYISQIEFSKEEYSYYQTRAFKKKILASLIDFIPFVSKQGWFGKLLFFVGRYIL